MPRKTLAAAILFALCVMGSANSASASPAQAVAAETCRAVTLRLYVRPNADGLDRYARSLIAAASRQVTGCAEPAFAFTLHGDVDDVAAREAAILNAFRAAGVARAMVQGAAVSQIAEIREPGPAYIEIDISPGPRNAQTAQRRAVRAGA